MTDHALSLGGIALGDTRASVVRKLGQPHLTTDTGDVLGTRMDYPGLTVWLDEDDRVGEMLSTSSQYCTPAGICPGTPFARARAAYGPSSAARREDGTYMEYPSSQSSCWLQISVSNDAVRSMRAECQP